MAPMKNMSKYWIGNQAVDIEAGIESVSMQDQ